MGFLYIMRVFRCGCSAGSGALQVTFWNVQQLMDVKRELMPALRRNRAKAATRDAYSAFGAGDASRSARTVQVHCQPSINHAAVRVTAVFVGSNKVATSGLPCLTHCPRRVVVDSTEDHMSMQHPDAQAKAPGCFAVIAGDPHVARVLKR